MSDKVTFLRLSSGRVTHPGDTSALGIILIHQAIVQVSKVWTEWQRRRDRRSVWVVGAEDLGRVLRHEVGHVIPQTIQARSVVHGAGDPGLTRRKGSRGSRLLRDDSLAAECSDPPRVATGRRRLRIDKPMAAYSQDDSAGSEGGRQERARRVYCMAVLLTCTRHTD